MAQDIIISQETINQVVDVILENNKLKSEEVFQDIFLQIRNLASDFKNSATEMFLYLEDYERDLNMVRQKWHEISSEYTSLKDKRQNLPNEYKQYCDRRKTLRQKYLTESVRQRMDDIYQQGFLLQSALNAFLNQKVETVIVWVGKAGIPETHILNSQPKLYMDINSKTGKSIMRYKISIRSLRAESESLEKQFLKEEQRDENFKFEELQQAYQKIKNRYDTYKTKGGGSYVLWLNPNKHPRWHGALISSFGSVNEAYASIFLHREYRPTITPEDDIEVLMNGVLGVTNLRGALEGDVSVKGTEYAIKSNRATVLSINQLLELADQIVNRDFSLQGLQNYLKQMKAEARANSAPINKAIDVNLTSTLESDVAQFITNKKYEVKINKLI